MHVLMLNYEYPPLGGGGGVATQTLIHSLAAKGTEVTLVTSSPSTERIEEHPSQHLTIIRLPVAGRQARPVASLSSLISYLRATIRWGKEQQHPPFSLVHSQFAVPTGIAGQHLAQTWNLPHLVTVHGFDIHDPTRAISADRFPPVHWVVQRVLGSAQAVTTQSRDIARRTRQGYNLKRDLTIIPLGIPKVNIPLGPKPDTLPDGFVLVGVGRLVTRKGFDIAISALPLLPDEVKLVIIGDGPEKIDLQKLSEIKGVTSRVHFLGPTFDQEKWNVLAHAQAYVLPSLHEGFSLSTVEAMMMGLPVIASNVGGQTDYLQPGVHALLIPPSNPEALAAAVTHLMQHPELCSRMKQHNIRLANQLTDEKMAERYQDLYAHLLHQ
ncbi:MAG: glycosyltransferase family 4 protein [Patescibacteria group bacterium]